MLLGINPFTGQPYPIETPKIEERYIGGGASSGGGGESLWEHNTYGSFNYLQPITTTDGLVIGSDIHSSVSTTFSGFAAAFNGGIDGTNGGLNYFLNLAYGASLVPLGGVFVGGRARGTPSAPTQTLADDWLGGVFYSGFGTTTFSYGSTAHTLPGYWAAAAANVTDAIGEQNIWLGGITTKMIGWESDTNNINFNEAMLDANMTWYYDLGTAMTLDGGTGAVTVSQSLTSSGVFSAATTIELGHASDTTLSRSAAGQLAVEGVDVLTTSNTKTVTNKRNQKRTATTNAPGATPTTNTDNVDLQIFTGLGTAITSMTTNLSGTPVNGEQIEFWFVDDGTARAITWGASFANGGYVSLPTTTVISTVLRVVLEYQTTASLNKWVCVSVA